MNTNMAGLRCFSTLCSGKNVALALIGLMPLTKIRSLVLSRKQLANNLGELNSVCINTLFVSTPQNVDFAH